MTRRQKFQLCVPLALVFAVVGAWFAVHRDVHFGLGILGGSLLFGLSPLARTPSSQSLFFCWLAAVWPVTLRWHGRGPAPFDMAPAAIAPFFYVALAAGLFSLGIAAIESRLERDGTGVPYLLGAFLVVAAAVALACL